ncbi:OmpA family protein [Winogradskyella bathintestinalis]|uniref:OmpA family protein n=1 Tax=Winogradskyella bathintestinalis TaxID=3035208 RepID=A0ABT7ZVT1_9FLAO|nr:OmpA family protein [Winogradskyella bathintestinalis]MDN3493099.1 OmpA family protein [Winogradskyella bathintestinalis]
MKNIYRLLSLFLVITYSSFGQNKHTEKADKLYNGYQYVDAIEAYQKIVADNEADTYVYKQLADSYYKIFNIAEASKWYKKALENNQDAETHFRYAQVLKSQGEYDAANKRMDVFAKMNPEDVRAKAHLKNPNYMPQLADISKTFNVEKVDINDDKQSDFGAVLSNDNILYFVSTRKTSGKEDAWTNQPYLDIYKSVRNDDGTLSDPEDVEDLNTMFHDGPISITADGKTMYFSRDGHTEGFFKKNKKKRIKVAQQGIYKATLIEGKWENIKALPINSKDYTVSHPSISSDGKTLYFASNMPSGFGDTDIWKISVNEDTYGEPENLGPLVNTSGKEGFPYISEDRILYFASSGRQGFGGLDIFKFDVNENKEAENLGNALNTKRDDFAFSVNNTFKVGYFSSNRSGVDNIYIATPICQFQTVTMVKNAESGAVLSNANVTILDGQLNEMASKRSDKNGKASFNVSCDNTYTLHVSIDGYESGSFKVEKSDGKEVIVNANLKPINEMITDTEVKLNNIYFEFNKSNITNRGALELDRLVEVMKDHPDMKILVRSHTDSKGSADYNLKLSDKRAQSTMQYLISQGINADRLSAKGMGQTDPKIDCKSDCTEDEDAQNRRSEFLIVTK